MTNQNIEKDQIKFENLFKSFFADLPNTSICISNNKIVIQEVSDENSDPASVDLELKNEKYIVYFWDGYSQSEVIEVTTEKDAVKTLKRFLKKLIKILNR